MKWDQIKYMFKRKTSSFVHNKGKILILLKFNIIINIIWHKNIYILMGKKFQDPTLQRFEHVYKDFLYNNIDFNGLLFYLKEIESKIKKMDKYASATTNIYRETEFLADMD